MSAQRAGTESIQRRQVENQLKRILDSDVFAGRGGFKKVERLAALLNHIVTETLDGRDVTENSLLIDFYKLSSEELTIDNTIARRNAGRLRGRLQDYYATQGLDEPLLIEIPTGQYVAEWEPNPKSPAQKEVRLGLYHVNREAPAHIRQALVHFDKAVALDRDFAEAYAGQAGALLTMTLHAYSEDPTALLDQAEEAAKKALALDEGSWLGHVNLGIVHYFRHDWDSADASFEAARKINSARLDASGGYGPYLLCRGRYKEGLDLAQRYLDEAPDDVVLLRRAALYLYALRYFAEAEEILLRTLQMDQHFWLSHQMLAYVYLARKEPQKALAHMSRVEPLTGMNLWPGLKVLCLEAAGMSKEVEKEFAELWQSSQDHYIQPMQLALGYLAQGNPLEAIAFLSAACEEGDPFTAWLHLWPFLDPLRRFPEFRALLRRWKFPSA